MNLSKKKVQEALVIAGASPIWEGSDNYSLHGRLINTGKVTNLTELINAAFSAGMEFKMAEIKEALGVIDPRI